MEIMRVQGHIPDQIAIISSVKTPAWRRWEDVNEDDEKISKETVTPAFVCDAANEKTIATAVSWADRNRISYDYKAGKNVTSSDPVVNEVRSNEPMKDLRVITLDIRSQGGRAYKVLAPDNYYYDLREDVLLDAMINVGIREGGYLNGEYIWARVSSTMKLIRIGSDLHRALVESTRKHKLNRIGKKTLEIGGVYITKTGDEYVYLGDVRTVKFSTRYNYGYYTKPAATITRRDFRGSLWAFLPSWEKKKTYQQKYDGLEKTHNYHIKASHTLVEKVGEVAVSTDVIKDVRDKAKAELAQVLNKQNADNHDYYRCHHSELVLMVPVDETVVLDNDYQNLAVRAHADKVSSDT